MSVRYVSTSGEPLVALDVHDLADGSNELLMASDGVVTASNPAHIDWIERHQLAQGLVALAPPLKTKE